MEKRLSKALAAAGIASRRAAEELIFEGRVRVNGKIVVVPQTLVAWGRDAIHVDGKPIVGEESKMTLLLNKPRGYICSSKPMFGKKIVLDLVPEFTERLYTIGRLDRDTSGLLLLTNDGALAHKVAHPSSRIQKEYQVEVREEISHLQLVHLSQGGFVEGAYVTPKKVSKMRSKVLKVVVMEGRKREVRRLVERVGLTVMNLKRIRIGNLRLGKLPEGHYLELKEDKLKLIFE